VTRLGEVMADDTHSVAYSNSLDLK
jgi:hypothetical protein